MMNMKWLMTASAFALITASTAKAADLVIAPDLTPVAPVVVAPTFLWTGFYIGGQIGSFSSKSHIDSLKKDTFFPAFSDDFAPKLSGFVGGVYAGSNIELGNGVIFGVDTDMVWSGKSDEKAGTLHVVGENEVARFEDCLKNAGIDFVSGKIKENDEKTGTSTLKENWAGATRIRIGFAADRVMPYISGGVSYARIQDVVSISIREKVNGKDDGRVLASGNLLDETRTLVGYTLGAGVDFAMTDNVILRTEYRYSDFGKAKFGNDKQEISHKNNDFRVGVAYKF